MAHSPSESDGPPGDSVCNVTDVTDLKRQLDTPTGAWLFLLRAAAIVGSAAIGATFHWYFHLVHTRPAEFDLLTGHTVKMVERGRAFYVTAPDQLVLYLLAVSIVAFLVPTLWLETRNKSRRDELPSSPYFEELQRKGMETHLGKLRKSPHDIFTLPVQIVLGVSVLVAGISIGWSINLFTWLGL